ncbi:hypothetical protein SUGI_1153580 [Cryptomeria japonica]|nr:hypothetical protein SUGI_1153580 [Cryptomeria japonica]
MVISLFPQQINLVQPANIRAECPLAPFFPPDEARRFHALHKVYGVSNVLNTFEDKKLAVQSLCWDAECRIREPIYGCMAVWIILGMKCRRSIWK